MGIIQKIRARLLRKNEDYTMDFDVTSIENRTEYIESLREQIKDNEVQIDQLLQEYEKLTSTIVDLQKIDRIPKANKKEILSIANALKTTNDERKRFQEKNTVLANNPYKYIELNQDSIKADIKTIKELEDRQLLLKNDMNHLEGEKGDLEYTRYHIIQRNKYVRIFSLVSVVIIALMLVALTSMISAGLEIVVPSIFLVFYGAFSIFIIFTNKRKSEHGIKVNSLKHIRANQIQDKVKIKYVNTTSYLEYEYLKYHVSSYSDLMYKYQQFTNRKVEARNYRNATDNILKLEEKLQEHLKKVGIGQGVIIKNNIDALVTTKALVDLIEEFTANRNKLKQQIEFNKESLQIARFKLNAIDKASNI